MAVSVYKPGVALYKQFPDVLSYARRSNFAERLYKLEMTSPFESFTQLNFSLMFCCCFCLFPIIQGLMAVFKTPALNEFHMLSSGDAFVWFWPHILKQICSWLINFWSSIFRSKVDQKWGLIVWNHQTLKALFFASNHVVLNRAMRRPYRVGGGDA